MRLLALSLTLCGALLLAGCSQIPVRRTYSLQTGYGGFKSVVSVTLEPPAKAAPSPSPASQ